MKRIWSLPRLLQECDWQGRSLQREGDHVQKSWTYSFRFLWIGFINGLLNGLHYLFSFYWWYYMSANLNLQYLSNINQYIVMCNNAWIWQLLPGDPCRSVSVDAYDWRIVLNLFCKWRLMRIENINMSITLSGFCPHCCSAQAWTPSPRTSPRTGLEQTWMTSACTPGVNETWIHWSTTRGSTAATVKWYWDCLSVVGKVIRGEGTALPEGRAADVEDSYK